MRADARHGGGGGGKFKRKKLTGAKRIALDALVRVMGESGILPDDAISKEFGLLGPTKVVSEEDWRERCYRSGIAEGDQDAKRRAFTRAKQALGDAGLLGTWDGFFWSKQPD